MGVSIDKISESEFSKCLSKLKEAQGETILELSDPE